MCPESQRGPDTFGMYNSYEEKLEAKKRLAWVRLKTASTYRLAGSLIY